MKWADLDLFLVNEAAAAKAALEKLWQQPLSQRVASGECLANVDVKDVIPFPNNGKARIFYAPDNRSKFRVGDYVTIHQDSLTRKCRCILVEDKGDDLVFLENEYSTSSLLDLDDSLKCTIDRDDADTTHILRSAINSCIPERQSKILSMVSGDEKCQFKEVDCARIVAYANQWKLNHTQGDAFKMAISTTNFFAIQGPPGTGKTRLLAAIVGYLVDSGEKVFVTAFTHRAINNALLKVNDHCPVTVKVGAKYLSEERVAHDKILINVEWMFESKFHELKNEFSTNFPIGGTIFSLFSASRLNHFEFDTIVFDEAGQINIPLAIAAMKYGKRFIFIGDHKQLSPIINYQGHPANIQQSIFEQIVSHSPGIMLNLTYRLNKELLEFPGKYFYQNRIRAHQDSANQKLGLTGTPPDRFTDILDPSSPCIFVNVNHTGCYNYSTAESDLVIEVVEEAINCGIIPKEIGVIAPYRAQGRVIKNGLSKRLKDLSAAVTVDTVERFQGQERELILISLTTSDSTYITEVSDFFFNSHRLNVALTRAKHKLIIFGNKNIFLKTIESFDQQSDGMKVFHDYLSQVQTIHCEV